MLLDWSPTCETHPHTTSSTMSGSTPARSISALSTIADRSAACMSDSPPLRLPTGVRTASTITVSRILLLRSVGRPYHTTVAQHRDLICAQTDFGEHGVGVLPQPVHGTHWRIKPGNDRRREQCR